MVLIVSPATILPYIRVDPTSIFSGALGGDGGGSSAADDMTSETTATSGPFNAVRTRSGGLPLSLGPCLDAGERRMSECIALFFR
ncbi:hypothetical protein MN608_11563 [Microdochium nivale]|nr:hypothetical protein MN608_11563 [Microdochium nivale]